MRPKSPPTPPERLATPRKTLLSALDHTPQTARELSARAGLSEKEVIHHLEHLLRSHVKLSIVPAACLACDFRFEKRDRLTRPGRCPICRSSRIEPPGFALSDE